MYLIQAQKILWKEGNAMIARQQMPRQLYSRGSMPPRNKKTSDLQSLEQV